MSAPYLIVGLGNPGSQYDDTPHNIGFALIDALSARWNCSSYQKKFQGQYTDAAHETGKVHLLKPQTYMNLSGRSVRELVSFFKLDPQTQLLIVSDDLDLPPGQLRLRKSGGTGGHNGLKSVAEEIGTQKFARLRIGIGRSSSADPSAHVLSKIPKKERQLYEESVDRAVTGIEVILKEGIDRAMNSVNEKKEKE